MRVLVICKNDDPIKNEGARVATTFLPLQVYGDFPRRARAANSAVGGQNWPNFEHIRDFMVVLVRELSIAMETSFQIRSGPQPDAAHFSQRYSCLNVFTDRQTNGRRLEYLPISSPCEPSAKVS